MVIIEHADWICGIMYARNAKRKGLTADLVVMKNCVPCMRILFNINISAQYEE